MKRRAGALSDAVLKEGREVTLTGRIAATMPCPGENALWVTVKVEGDQWVEVSNAT